MRSKSRHIDPVRLSPGAVILPKRFLACAYVERDRIDDAHEEIKAALESSPDCTATYVDRVLTVVWVEARDRFLDGPRNAGMPEDWMANFRVG